MSCHTAQGHLVTFNDACQLVWHYKHPTESVFVVHTWAATLLNQDRLKKKKKKPEKKENKPGLQDTNIQMIATTTPVLNRKGENKRKRNMDSIQV